MSVAVAVAVAVAMQMARRLRSSVVMGFEKGCRGGGEDGCRGGGAREGRGWRLHGHLPLGLDLLPTVHLQCTWFCSERMQCTCSAHAVHMQCTCSAHAVHMQCACSVRPFVPCPYTPCIQWPCRMYAGYSCPAVNYTGVQQLTFTPLASTTASSAEPLLSAAARK